MNSEKLENTFQIVGPKNAFPKVTLVDPSNSGYLLLALEIDRRPPIGFFIESQIKKKILSKLKSDVVNLRNNSKVIDATVFKAMIIPPGRGAFLKKRPSIEIAKFDVVMLIEFDTHESVKEFQKSLEWQNMEETYKSETKKSLTVTGVNVRRIGPVDHSKKGVFLFNYFYADQVKQNLQVWEYTAGWFQDQTGLDNSTLILPDQVNENSYKIINHCRWDHLINILPSLIFKKSFKEFVLNNFEANNVAAMPILYRLA
jgi:hypothetical protein